MDRYRIPSLARACEALELFVEAEAPLSSSEVARRLSMPRTTALRILMTLCEQGLLSRSGNDFEPGGALFRLGIRALSAHRLRRFAIPILQRLAGVLRETSQLVTLSGTRCAGARGLPRGRGWCASPRAPVRASICTAAPPARCCSPTPCDRRLPDLVAQGPRRPHAEHPDDAARPRSRDGPHPRPRLRRRRRGMLRGRPLPRGAGLGRHRRHARRARRHRLGVDVHPPAERRVRPARRRGRARVSDGHGLRRPAAARIGGQRRCSLPTSTLRIESI